MNKQTFSPHFILTAAGFPEVSDGGKLCMDRLSIEPAIIEVHNCLLCVFFTAKLHPVLESNYKGIIISHCQYNFVKSVPQSL